MLSLKGRALLYWRRHVSWQATQLRSSSWLWPTRVKLAACKQKPLAGVDQCVSLKRLVKSRDITWHPNYANKGKGENGCGHLPGPQAKPHKTLLTHYTAENQHFSHRVGFLEKKIIVMLWSLTVLTKDQILSKFTEEHFYFFIFWVLMSGLVWAHLILTRLLKASNKNIVLQLKWRLLFWKML